MLNNIKKEIKDLEALIIVSATDTDYRDSERGAKIANEVCIMVVQIWGQIPVEFCSLTIACKNSK